MPLPLIPVLWAGVVVVTAGLGAKVSGNLSKIAKDSKEIAERIEKPLLVLASAATIVYFATRK